MTCWKIQKKLSGYLDGAMSTADHQVVREHLEFCGDCRMELERYRKLALLTARVERALPPPDLAVKICVAVSRQRNGRSWAERMLSRADLTLKNFLQPLALPATGGLVVAMLMFLFGYQVIGGGVPLGAVPNDLPTNLLQPARLETLGPFPSPAFDENGAGVAQTLVVEALVNARGEMVDYQILSGPNDLSIRRQLDQVLFFSRFRPQMSFGRPTPGGRVLLNFSVVLVRG